MGRSWTFGQKIGGGFALAVVFVVVIGLISFKGTWDLIQISRWVTHSHQETSKINHVLSLLRDLESGQRGYVITGNDRFLSANEAAQSELHVAIQELRQLASDSPAQARRIDQVEPLIDQRIANLKHIGDVRQAKGFAAAEQEVATLKGYNLMEQIRSVFADMANDEGRLMNEREASAAATARMVQGMILGGTLLAFCSLSLFGYFIARSLSAQIQTAVTNLQSSSTELRAAANQQASASTEQSTSMNELATTMKEILTSSRHITDNAQRVARISGETSHAAQAGDRSVTQAHESMEIIRRRVEQIVAHMLGLGKKSQQIGGILDIITELAEQTNILAINATIESAAAGESGRRFAAVADEIRKLADRVSGSTREIRPLIDEIRAAANTTVMATEEGAKAVDVGSRQFEELTNAFERIVDLVATTAEAAREIELGTKQQTTAIEQVNLAISDVAQAAKETEVSSRQTLQTSTQLTVVSRELANIVQQVAKA